MDYFKEYEKKQFLIKELHRFIEEFGFVPTQKHINETNGYPYVNNYVNYFGSFNNALIEAGLEINKISDRLDGSETCFYCNKRANEIINFTTWLYPNGVRYCHKHGQKGLRDYVKGELDKNSTVAKGFIGQRVVAKTLNIPIENDCNCSIGFGSKFDLYNEKYGKIDVKTSVLREIGFWQFGFNAKKVADTYICLGFDEERKYILRVWMVPNEGKFRDLMVFNIHNSKFSLKEYKKFEVDSELYDLMLYKLSLKRKETNGENCVLSSDDLEI